MRIAYFVNQYPKVSHSFIRREILALERQGFEVQRYALRGWDAELVDEADVLERSRTRYVLRAGAWRLLAALLAALLGSPRRGWRALVLALRVGRRAERPLPYHLVYLAEACLLHRWMQQAQVQHVHAHFATNSAEVVMLARVLGGPPYSFTAHREDELQSGGIGDKLRHAAFVVAVSSHGRGQLYRLLAHERWPMVKLVHCGLEPGFHQVARSAPPSPPRLVYVGRLDAEKGTLLLLEAAERLAQRGIGFELVLAGDGEMRPQIERRIAQGPLGGRVRLTGWLSSAQVREEMLAARALVLPSFLEGLPVVIMEAMALRRPVVSTYVGGIPELVRPGETGWLVPAGSVDQLAAALEQCLAMSPDALLAFGDAAHARCLARHSIDAEAAKLAQFLRESRATK